jgi:hypothetical protein
MEPLWPYLWCSNDIVKRTICPTHGGFCQIAMSYWSGPWTLQSNSQGHVGSELAKWSCFGRMTSRKTHWANNNVAKWPVCLPGRYFTPTAVSFSSIHNRMQKVYEHQFSSTRPHWFLFTKPRLPVDTFFCQSTNSRLISTFQPLILQPQHRYERSNRTR